MPDNNYVTIYEDKVRDLKILALRSNGTLHLSDKGEIYALRFPPVPNPPQIPAWALFAAGAILATGLIAISLKLERIDNKIERLSLKQ